MNIQISPQKNMEKNQSLGGQYETYQPQVPPRGSLTFGSSRNNALVSNANYNSSNNNNNNNNNNMIATTNNNVHIDQTTMQIKQSNPSFVNQKGVSSINNIQNINNNNNTNAAANANANMNAMEVKVISDLQLSQQDFEKKFTKTADKRLNKSDYYETWKYEMNGELYIVKKYVKLDDVKWKKLVNSYNLQYHLASSSSLFLKPYKLVAFSEAVVTSSHHNRLGQNAHQGTHHHQNQQHHQSQFGQTLLGQKQQQQLQQRRWQLYVIYPYLPDNISLEKIFTTPAAMISDIDLISIATQIFRIGQLCAEKNFPLINWKFSNLIIQLKPASSSLFQSQQQQQQSQQQPQQLASQNMIKSQRQNQLDALQSPMPTSPYIKMVENTLRMMDLYDYSGIENRESNDLLLPPELRSDQRKQSSTVHFEDYHGTLEQSSIYMTGMMLAQLLKKKFEEVKKGEGPITRNSFSKPQASPAASVNSENAITLNKKPTNVLSGEEKKKNLLTNSSSNSQATQIADLSQVQALYDLVDQIIETQARTNPLIYTLAMIIKITITPNPKERPTFSSALDVFRDIFGEILDEKEQESQKYTKSEKDIIMLLGFANTLLESHEQDRASTQMNRAKKILIMKSKKYQLSPKVNAFYFFTTGKMFMLQGRIAQAVKQYTDGLREIQAIENAQEDLLDELYYYLNAQILLQLGVCSFKLNQCYKALLYVHESIKILRIQEKIYQQPQIKNSQRLKFFKLMAFALMWRAQIERIVGNYENMNLDFFFEDHVNQSHSKISEEKKSYSQSQLNHSNRQQQKQDPIELVTIKEALKYVSKSSREYAKIVLVKAKILSSRGSTDKALKYVNAQQEYLESQNKNMVPDLLIMECYYVKGIIYFQKDNIQESIKHFQLAQQVFEARGEANHPDCSPIYQKLAKCYARIGKLSQASSLHERAMHLNDPNLQETNLVDTRFLKQPTEEPECLLMYNYCLHLKEQGDLKSSKQLTHELMQNYSHFLSPAPEFVNKMLDFHYNSLNLKIKISKS